MGSLPITSVPHPGCGVSDGRGEESAARRARIITKHFPQDAVSEWGRQVAARFLAAPTSDDRLILDALDPRLFVSYFDLLRRHRLAAGDADALVHTALDGAAIVELMVGCPYDCAMCYIDAPKVQGFMPWVHAVEVFGAIARHQRQVLRNEALDVLVCDALGGRFPRPRSILDVAISLARHRRNRFRNNSDHIMAYWRSNPVSYRDPLFERHFGHVFELVAECFQLFRVEALAERALSEPASAELFAKQFGSSIEQLRDGGTIQTIISTVPFGPNSLGDQAIRFIERDGRPKGKFIRVSIPHPSMMSVKSGASARYFENVKYSLSTSNPRMVYLFARNLAELEEIVSAVALAFESFDAKWWREARLMLFELREARRNRIPEAVTIERLKRIIRHIPFIGTLEGRGSQFAGNPLFEKRGTVMCVNGLVLQASGKIAFQACTTPEAEDVDEGLIIPDLDLREPSEICSLLQAYPLVNRSREAVTPQVAEIPLAMRRKRWNWFEQRKADVADHPEMEVVKAEMSKLLDRSLPYLMLE